MFNNFEKAYLKIIREQADVCPDCGNNPCTCNGDSCNCDCGFTNFNELIEKFSTNVSKEGLIKLLNIAVNDELLATYNYLASYTLSKTEGKVDFDPEFKAHEEEELEHAHLLINRLRELNAEVLTTCWSCFPQCNSAGASWTQEKDSNSIAILTRRYQEELNAIEFYGFVLGYIKELAKGNESEADTTTHRLLKKIKADEEEHAKDLRDLLVEFGVELDDDKTAQAKSQVCPECGNDPCTCDEEESEENDADEFEDLDENDESEQDLNEDEESEDTEMNEDEEDEDEFEE